MQIFRDLYRLLYYATLLLYYATYLLYYIDCFITPQAAMGKGKRYSTRNSLSFAEEIPKKSVKELIDEAVALLRTEYDQEICALKAEIVQIKESQSFLSEKYDCLNEDYNKLKKINAEQKAEITALKSESSDLKNTSLKEIEKIDNLEQYGRRQNLEIAGIPVQDGEDTNAVVMEVAKLLDVDILPSHISTSHRLPKKIGQNGNVIRTPPIIVRFTNRDIRNKLYANRKQTRTLDLKKFSVNDTKKIFINENLTQSRKRLFWKTKQRAKNENWKYYWTHNGSILAKKDDDTDAIPIKSDLDLDLIKK